MSKNDLRYISDNMVARESALQMLILEAVGFGYELVRLACPRNPTERNPTERNTETQRHRVFILCEAINLCASVSLCSILYPLDLWSLAARPKGTLARARRQEVIS